MSAKQRGMEKKAKAEEERERKAAEEEEHRLAAEWSVGAKSSSKQVESEMERLEKARKKAEAAALLAEEEASVSSGKRPAGAKLKKKGKDDFDMLNAALAAAPKTKAQKEAEAKKKADEERKKKEEEKREAKALKLKKEDDERREAARRGIVIGDSDILMSTPINNTLDEDEGDVTGIEAALDLLVAGGGAPEVTSRKALFNAFKERVIPQLREETPGLRLSQYHDRAFELWQKSPENPANAKA